MNTQKWILGCGLASGLLVVGLVFVVILANVIIPDVNQQIAPQTNPIFVIIEAPLNEMALPVNQPVMVFVDAFGDQPVQNIQLMLDGTPLPGGAMNLDGPNKLKASWNWVPGKDGLHTLLARATAQNGQTSMSYAVNVKVMPNEQIPLPVVVQGSGSIPPVINDDSGQDAQNAAPMDWGSAAPPPGFNAQGAINNPPPFPDQPAGQGQPFEQAPEAGGNLIPIKYSYWFQTLLQSIVPVTLPAAPTLDGGVNQCEAILMVQDNAIDEIGFNLYRLSPESVKFQLVATLDGQPGKTAFSYHDPGLALGNYIYYIETFNAAGGTDSDLVYLSVTNTQCAAANPSGVEIFKQVIAIDPAKAISKAYCYGSAGTSAWVRLPAGQDNFIFPLNNQIDLAPYWELIPLPQPTPSQLTLTLDCWGWSGGALVYLGASSQTINTDPTPTPDPDGTLGEPPKEILIAAPYNAYFTNDPNVCKDHVAYGPDQDSYIQNCKDLITEYGYVLVWTYNRFGPCNPQSDVCYMDYQPATDFDIYTIKNGEPKYAGQPGKGAMSTFANVKQQTDFGSEFFVRAYAEISSKMVFSPDSNHVLYKPDMYVTTIQPTSVEQWRWKEVYDGTASSWDLDSSPYELTSGYAFTCLNNCSAGQYRDFWYRVIAKFTLPENMNVQYIQLNWHDKNYTTSGPGVNNVAPENCGVELSSPLDDQDPPYWDGLTTNTTLWSSGKVDLTFYLKPSWQTWQSSTNSYVNKRIEFLFSSDKAPAQGPRAGWDRCLWVFDNLSLTIRYFK